MFLFSRFKKKLSLSELRRLSYLKKKLRSLFWRMRGKRIVYILHIGKTGGSALAYAVKNYLVTPKYRIIFCKHWITLSDIPKKDKAVFCIRHPVERFISGFYSRKFYDMPKPFFLWNPGEKKAYETFNTHNDLALGLSSKDPKIRQEAICAMQSIEHIRSFYSDWFRSEEYFLSRLKDILFIGLTERLDQDFEKLKKILYMKESIKLPKDKQHAHVGSYNVRLDEEAKCNLLNWYKDDIKFYNFLKEAAKQINLKL